MEHTQIDLPSFSSDAISPINVNLSYQYTSDDISRAISAELYKENYDSDDYLLSGIFKEGGSEYYVAIIGPVDATDDQRSTPLEYFLNKKNQPGSVIMQQLTKLLPHLNELGVLSDSFMLRRIKEIIREENDDIYPTLLTYLKEKNFDLNELQLMIEQSKETESHDLFDEIGPLFLSHSDLCVKIVFPYNTNFRNKNNNIILIGGHWLTGEINLYKENNTYRVIITAHNPYGGGNIKPSDTLQRSIESRIRELYPENELIDIAIEFVPSPFSEKRQFDIDSCGVIEVDELLKRIKNKALNEIYPAGCKELRERQYESMVAYNNAHSLQNVNLAPLLINAPEILSTPSYLDNVPSEMTNEKAMAILNIDKVRLDNIPTAKLRKKYIDYKYLLSELRYSLACRTYGFDEESVLAELDKIYEQLSHTSAHYPTEFSSHSVGLWDLEVRSVYKKTAHESIITIGSKEPGVEPGFLAALKEDAVINLKKTHPNRKERLDFFRRHCGDFKLLYESCKDKMPQYMVKRDYELTAKGKAAFKSESLRHSHAIQKIYQFNKICGDLSLAAFKYSKTGTLIEKNCDAVLEALSNDIARASGMQVQEQTLLKSTYENGKLKFMLKSRWMMNASTFAPLAGALKGTYHNYRVMPALWKPAGIQYLVNDSISDLATYFATLLVQDDLDAIGSTGGNKLELNNALFGIDFGFSSHKTNTIIQSLLPNLRLPENLLKTYKNFSVFYDAPYSEMIKGALIYAKLIGRPIFAELLQQYDLEFQEKMNGIETDSLNQLFDDYERKFKTLALKESKYQTDYLIILDKIKATQLLIMDSIDKLLVKLQDKIDLPPKVNDLIENLEKVTLGPTETSLRSPDGTVLLNHLRVLNEQKLIPWQVNVTPERYEFVAAFKGTRQAQDVRQRLKTLTGKSVAYTIKKGQLQFSCAKDAFDDLYQHAS